VKGSPVDPNRLYASQSSGWFGQMIQRSDDGGSYLGPGWATSSPMTACRERTSGTTARRIRGSSSACGTWSLRSLIRTQCSPGSKTRRSSSRPTAARVGQELAGLREHGTGCRPGSRARAACACTRSSGPRAIRSNLYRHLRGGGVPHRRRRRQLEAHQPRDCTPSTCRTLRRRSATACIMSPCTRRGPTCCSCRSIGT
jgi:hypothetical protein